jgi:hypothetical protein
VLFFVVHVSLVVAHRFGVGMEKIVLGSESRQEDGRTENFAGMRDRVMTADLNSFNTSPAIRSSAVSAAWRASPRLEPS